MSDTTTITPIAAFNPANRFVTFEGLKDYDANLISNLHSLGYNNKVSGANIFAWGNNNRIDGQNLFVFGNGFNRTTNQKYPSLFLGNGYALGEWKGAEDTIFGVWGTPSEGPGRPIFRVGAESEEQITAAFSIRNNGSFSAAQNNFIVNADGSFSAANGAFNVGLDGSFSIDNSRFQINDNSFVIKYSSGLVATGSLTPFYIYDGAKAFEISWNGTITTLNHQTVQWLPIEIDGTKYYCLGLIQKPS